MTPERIIIICLIIAVIASALAAGWLLSDTED